MIQDRVLAGALALDEEVVEGHDALRPRLFALRDPEIGQDVLEHVVERQGRVEMKESAVSPLSRWRRRATTSSCPSHLPGEQDESLALLGSVVELGEASR